MAKSKAPDIARLIMDWDGVMSNTMSMGRRLSLLTGLQVLRPPIRSTGISDAEHCLRYFLFKERLGLQSTRYDSALTIGKIYHALRRLLASNIPQPAALHRAASLMADWQKNITDNADPRGLYHGVDAQTLIDKSRKDWGVAQAMACFAHDQTAQDDRYETLSVEQDIEIYIKLLRTPVHVRLDVLSRSTQHGHLAIGDHKTTSDSPLIVIEATTFAIQPRLYRLAFTTWQQAQPDAAPLGKLKYVVHDVIQKLGIRLKQRESLEEYIDRVRKEYQKNIKEVKAGTAPPKFLRSAQDVAQQPLIDEEFLLHLRHMDRLCFETPTLEKFPRCADPLHTCFKFGKPCEFLPLCTTNPDRWRQEIIPLHYEQVVREDEEKKDDVTWHPEGATQ